MKRFRSKQPVVLHVAEAFGAGTAGVIVEIARGLKGYRHIVIHGRRTETETAKQLLASNEVEFIDWPYVRREIRPVRDAAALISLVRRLARVPDVRIIHLHSAKAGFLGRVAARVLGLSSRTIYTTHCSPVLRKDVNAFGRYVFRCLEGLAAKCGGKVIACSESESRELHRWGIESTAIPNGAELCPRRPSGGAICNRERLRIGTVGRATTQKDPGFFARVAQRAMAEGPFSFSWIGGGEQEEALRAAGIAATGWLPQSEASRRTDELDIYLSTSLWEGLSLGVLQAMAAAKPLVLRRCPGNVDVVRHGWNGFLFDTLGDAVSHIRTLANDPDMREQMGERSRRLCAEMFSAEKMVSQYRRLYRRISAGEGRESESARAVGEARPPRVLMVLEASGGGAGRHVLDLSEGLVRRGCEVHLLYSRSRADVLFMQRLQNCTRLNVHEFYARRHLHPSDVLAVREIRKYIRDNGPFDIIHGHGAKGGAVARLARGCAPIVHTFHGLHSVDPSIRVWRRLLYSGVEAALGALTDRLIAVSPEEKSAADRFGVGSSRVVMIPKGIGAESVTPRWMARAKLGASDDAVVIGFVGRLVEQKAPDMLLRAFATVAAEHRQARLIMIGDGPMGPVLRQVANELNIHQRITWLGECDAKEYMTAFDIFALSSKKEGLPYVILEAMREGLPVVATSASNVSLVLDQGKNGYVVPTGDQSAFACALGRLVADAGLRATFGEHARGSIRRCSVDAMIDETLKAYREVMKSKREWPDRLKNVTFAEPDDQVGQAA